MKTKNFPGYTSHGLGITKSGRLQVPCVYSNDSSSELNGYGQPMAKIGDKIAMVSHTGRMTKHNVGIMVNINKMDVSNLPSNGKYVVLKNIAGDAPKDDEWLGGAYVLSDEEYNDAIEYLL